MKTIYINPREMAIVADLSNNDVKALDAESMYSMQIDRMYIAPEDCEVRIKSKGTTTIKNAQKGDVILQFYNREWIPEPVAIIKNAELKKNIVAAQAKRAGDQAELECKASFTKCKDCSCSCDIQAEPEW